MKSAVTAICLFISLMVIVIIADRMEFNRYNDVQTVQSESHSTNRKPAVSVLETTAVTEVRLAVETKPVSKTTPVEAKSVAETKLEVMSAALPVVTEEAIKANEERLHQKEEVIVQTDSVAEKNITGNKTSPTAVPVLTPEEAIKANEEAIRSQRNKKIIQSSVLKKALNSNRVHFVVSLLPLLLIVDLLLLKKKKKKSSKILDYFSLSRRIRILFSVSLLAFGILIFVPWSVYFGNSLQFPFIFQDFVNWNLCVLTISIVGVCIVLLLIPPNISDYLVAVIAGLGLCVYVQAMFMNQNLGTMDGNEPQWSEHRIWGEINLVIWCVIILIPVVLRKVTPSYFSKIISATTGFVFFLELIATVSMVFSADQDVWARTGKTFFQDGSKQFQLSKKKNIIVFIFDTLGSEFVKLSFEKYPEDREIVKDFIWYVDARSNYPKTFPGLTHELTGAFLPAPANKYYDYFEKMWRSPSAESFYKQINDAGYDARLYCSLNKSVIGPEANYSRFFSNVKQRDVSYEINYDRLHSCLKYISGFSFAPYLAKKYFFYSFDFSNDVVQVSVAGSNSDKKTIPSLNQRFLKKLTSQGITTDSDKSILSVYYTFGVHRPWTLDEKCNRMSERFDNPIPTTRSCFYILSEFIRLLKEANIYDNTAIMVISDHGGNDDVYSTPYDMTFMVKPFHENKASLTIDNSKVQSIDILPTLLQIACGDKADFKDFEGFSLSNVPEQRVRTVTRYVRVDGFPLPDENVYAGRNCLEEYNFVDVESFRYGRNSKSFVRLIPLASSQKDK